MPGYLLTSSESMPYVDNNIEEVRPAPPPPTIKTGTVISLKMLSLGAAVLLTFLASPRKNTYNFCQIKSCQIRFLELLQTTSIL